MTLIDFQFVTIYMITILYNFKSLIYTFLLMNVFILNTGRCGSLSFIKACSHITNYTAAHESLSNQIKDARFAYPENHIEADNRLSWLIGRLDEIYGDNAIYVHLKRDKTKVAQSLVKRFKYGIIRAYKNSILMGTHENASPMEISLDYIETIEKNINLFLKDKSKKMEFILENTDEDFKKFWTLIAAEDNIEAALSEFKKTHNATRKEFEEIYGASSSKTLPPPPKKSFLVRVFNKIVRITPKTPQFIKKA